MCVILRGRNFERCELRTRFSKVAFHRFVLRASVFQLSGAILQNNPRAPPLFRFLTKCHLILSQASNSLPTCFVYRLPLEDLSGDPSPRVLRKARRHRLRFLPRPNKCVNGPNKRTKQRPLWLFLCKAVYKKNKGLLGSVYVSVLGHG